MLKSRSEVALEIVLDDKDAKEVGVAPAAENVPGKGSDAERDDGKRVK